MEQMTWGEASQDEMLRHKGCTIVESKVLPATGARLFIGVQVFAARFRFLQPSDTRNDAR
jgi:hypothetical protein